QNGPQTTQNGPQKEVVRKLLQILCHAKTRQRSGPPPASSFSSSGHGLMHLYTEQELISLAMQWGVAGLGIFSFLAATLLPLSSELALMASWAAGLPVWETTMAASLGNSAGCLFNYGLGWS